jgi:hypothetical protein
MRHVAFRPSGWLLLRAGNERPLILQTGGITKGRKWRPLFTKDELRAQVRREREDERTVLVWTNNEFIRMTERT